MCIYISFLLICRPHCLSIYENNINTHTCANVNTCTTMKFRRRATEFRAEVHTKYTNTWTLGGDKHTHTHTHVCVHDGTHMQPCTMQIFFFFNSSFFLCRVIFLIHQLLIFRNKQLSYQMAKVCVKPPKKEAVLTVIPL